MDDFERIARRTGTMPSEARRQLDSAVRRSEPDAREIYGLIAGMRLLGAAGPEASKSTHNPLLLT